MLVVRLREARAVSLGVRRLSVALLACASLAACTSDGGGSSPTASASATASSSASASATEQVPAGAQDALQAYVSFQAALAAAQANPVSASADETPPADADVSQWSWDPLRADMVSYIHDLADQQVHFEGTRPQLHPRVESVDLDADPWPTVVISDCADSDAWDPFSEDGTEQIKAGATG